MSLSVSKVPSLRRSILSGLVLVTLAMVLMFSPLAAMEATPGVLPGQNPNASCASGRLKVRDLAAVDQTLEGGVKRATEKATAWQSDSRLYTLRLGCPLLTAGYQWEGVFFSESAQAFYATDTGVVEAVNDDPASIPSLNVSEVSLQEIYKTLLRAGFGDDLLLSAAGAMTIRHSTETHPFGPTSAPRDQVYAHVAIEVSGQVTDVWIAISDGTIYRYGR